MKKLISLILMLILVIGIVPLVFAHHEGARDRDSDREDRDGPLRSIANDKTLRRANQQLLEVPDLLKKVRRTNLAGDRSMLQKKDAMEIRERLRECKENDEEDCKNLRKVAKVRAKHSMLKITERILSVLNTLKEGIENSDMENKDEALSEINAAITNIEGAKSNIDALSEDSDREEVKAAIRELKNALDEAHDLVKEYHSKVRINEKRLQNAINRYRKLIGNIGERLDKFEERGHDFSGLKSKLDDVGVEVRDAQTALDNGELREALGLLKQAHDITINILREFRANISDDGDDEEIECTTNEDCEEGLICDDGECEEEEEIECTTNEDCEEGLICDDGECEEEEEIECTTNEDCEEGMICDEDGECEAEGGDDDE